MKASYKTCDTCDWCEEKLDYGMRKLTCHCYPPTVTEKIMAQYPRVEKDGWCGKWKSRIY